MAMNMLVIFFGGLSNGLPGVLTWQTLNIWLYELGCSKTLIGLMFFCGLPYSFKFLLSPIVEYVKIPFFSVRYGRRKTWAVFSQCLMMAFLFCIGFFTHEGSLHLTALFCFLTSFFSALNQIATVAHRIEILNDDHTAQGVAVGITGYRLGKLLGRAGALYLMTFLPWSVIYYLLASMLSMSIVFYCLAEEPSEPSVNDESDHKTLYRLFNRRYPAASTQSIAFVLYSTFVYPFIVFKTRFKNPIGYLTIILLINISDDLLAGMNDLFFLEIGFSPLEIANITKIFGLFCSLAGGFIAAKACSHMGVLQVLFYSTIAHSISHLLLMLLSIVGHNTILLIIIVALEYLTSGMKAALLATIISYFCKSTHYTGTQYAFFSSIKSIPLIILSSVSGMLKDCMEWKTFFCAGFVISLPILFALYLLKNKDDSEIYLFPEKKHS